MNKCLNVHYVDRATYLDVIEAGGDLDDILDRNKDKLSLLTISNIDSVDNLVSRILLSPSNDYSFRAIKSELGLSELECQHSDSYAENYLLDKEDDECKVYAVSEENTQSNHGSQKYYEIFERVNPDYNDLLVVCEKGFLSAVTETKEELESFFLTVLRHWYNDKYERFRYLEEYLGLRVSDATFELVKFRLEGR